MNPEQDQQALRAAAEAALAQRPAGLAPGEVDGQRLLHDMQVAVDRELAMIGLKQQANALSQQLGQTPFKLDFVDPPTPGVTADANPSADRAPP
ncbi:hypothetical protein ACCAA_310098 [Candidatus Accumulibacter aalborgensis]|uniref:Uncharacterized protein n=1 Tax=Candidatus Accumulibacter aalborgensis TaxID=1860102 RepID=A0A1A8XQX6_9PROT|nr:hypothetical protein [Candidatus Accumulibacter aalborgensis]SBT06368.1 hypothetical protein ACCAA_310098 [Candidatus Accumulibacter aalborgensis]